MNSKPKQTKLILVGCFLTVLVVSGAFMAIVWAAAGPSRPDYQGYDLESPWFDGKSWDWFLDMFNQESIKPQEEGTIQQFPTDSVPRSGMEPSIGATAIFEGGLLRDRIPINPKMATPESISRGKGLYNIFCSVCHGEKGEGDTPVTKLGMPAPPIAAMVKFLTEPHLYNKIRYGGPIMPAYGFQTSKQDRWDMVNYMKTPRFGNGGAQ